MHEAMLRLPLVPPLVIEEQTAGKGLVSLFFIHLLKKSNKIFKHLKSFQTERVIQTYKKNNNNKMHLAKMSPAMKKKNTSNTSTAAQHCGTL